MSVTVKELKDFLECAIDSEEDVYIDEGGLTLCYKGGYLEIGGKSVENKIFIFTFGVGHPYRGRYVKILAPTIEEAEEIMNRAHGDQWADARPEEDGHRVIEEYGYTCLAILQGGEQ